MAAGTSAFTPHGAPRASCEHRHAAVRAFLVVKQAPQPQQHHFLSPTAPHSCPPARPPSSPPNPLGPPYLGGMLLGAGLVCIVNGVAPLQAHGLDAHAAAINFHACHTQPHLSCPPASRFTHDSMHLHTPPPIACIVSPSARACLSTSLPHAFQHLHTHTPARPHARVRGRHALAAMPLAAREGAHRCNIAAGDQRRRRSTPPPPHSEAGQLRQARHSKHWYRCRRRRYACCCFPAELAEPTCLSPPRLPHPPKSPTRLCRGGRGMYDTSQLARR